VDQCLPSQQTCGAGQACYPYVTNGRTLTHVEGICRAAGAGSVDSPCKYLNDCAAGLACLEPWVGAQPVCRPICALDGSLPCAGGWCTAITSRFGACW
jgi:hypothetical protein